MNRSDSDDSAELLVATFRIDSEWYGIDVLQVQEVMTPMRETAVPLAPPGVLGLINVRGLIVTVLSVKQRLGLQPADYTAEHHNVIVKIASGAVCLRVDEIGDVIAAASGVAVEPPSTVPEQARVYLRRVIKLDDRLIGFLDVDALAAA